MALLRPKSGTSKRSLPAYTVLLCPYNGHQVSWCMQLCQPVQGHGWCGRVATHDMIGRTQAAIAQYKETAAADRGAGSSSD